MAIVQDEVTLFKVTNGEDGGKGDKGDDGKNAYNHKAFAWSSDGTDRFTLDYPNENLIRGLNNSLPELKTQNLSSSVFYIAEGTGTKIEALKEYLFSIEGEANLSNKAFVNIGLGKKEGEFNYDLTARLELTKDRTQFFFGASQYQIDTYGSFLTYRIRNEQKEMTVKYGKVKLEHSNYQSSKKKSIYTPSPLDDYENAYPKYKGEYSSFDPIPSTNPSDYKPWMPWGGQKGEDGVTPKDVVSGSLTNESLIVPANPAGVVSDYSKAYGDFVVYEGQTKITSGVTYSKVSEAGMTSTISSAGRYVVTAMSADVGTATYRAVYDGVTINKIMMIVKNKQGATGNTGSAGATGSQGAKGDTGATGSKGDPTGVTRSATEPVTKFVNMLWQHTGNLAGRITNATYRWNGSAWELYIFVAENILATTLSAISANLGNITAGTITGATFISPFDRVWQQYPNLGRRGSVKVSDGLLSLEYEEYFRTANTLHARGKYELDEFGFSMTRMNSNSVPEKITSYGEDGIVMINKVYDYGDVVLGYEDLMAIASTELSPAMNHSIYSTGETNLPTARRQGRVITLSGAFKPNGSLTSSNDEITMGYLPVWARPTEPFNQVVQGSGMNRFNLMIRPDGQICWSRYGTTAYATVPAGAWLNISCTFTAKNM